MPGRREIVFRIHAVERMFERGVSVHVVRGILQEGEEIESYPQDRPYPSRLLLGWLKDRPIHIVAADNPEGSRTFVITVYEPAPDLWEPGFRVRRRDT